MKEALLPVQEMLQAIILLEPSKEATETELRTAVKAMAQEAQRALIWLYSNRTSPASIKRPRSPEAILWENARKNRKQ